MPASFPGSIKNFGADRIDGEYIPAEDVNGIRAEVVAVETEFSTVQGDLTAAQSALADLAAAQLSGWIAAPAWTYVAVNKFSVVGNLTDVYTKALRLRWKQGGGFKYGNVQSSSYSAGVTTVTIIVNSDYSVANSAITDNSISNMSDPAGWPGWFNYATTIVGFSSPPATAEYRYKVDGQVMTVSLAEGSNGTSNGAGLTYTMPVDSVNVSGCAVSNIYDNATSIADGFATLPAASNVLTVKRQGGTGFTASGGKRAGNLLIMYQW